jgi:hypothetical protein
MASRTSGDRVLALEPSHVYERSPYQGLEFYVVCEPYHRCYVMSLRNAPVKFVCEKYEKRSSVFRHIMCVSRISDMPARRDQLHLFAPSQFDTLSSERPRLRAGPSKLRRRAHNCVVRA